MASGCSPPHLSGAGVRVTPHPTRAGEGVCQVTHAWHTRSSASIQEQSFLHSTEQMCRDCKSLSALAGAMGSSYTCREQCTSGSLHTCQEQVRVGCPYYTWLEQVCKDGPHNISSSRCVGWGLTQLCEAGVEGWCMSPASRSPRRWWRHVQHIEARREPRYVDAPVWASRRVARTVRRAMATHHIPLSLRLHSTLLHYYLYTYTVRNTIYICMYVFHNIYTYYTIHTEE